MLFLALHLGTNHHKVQHDKHEHEDIYVAIRDAFNAFERRLKSVYGKQRRLGRHAKKLGEELSILAVGEEAVLDQ